MVLINFMNGTLSTMNRSLLNISDLKKSEIYDILSLQDNPDYLKKKKYWTNF